MIYSRGLRRIHRKPFWLSAIAYYFLCLIIAAVFLLLSYFFSNENEDHYLVLLILMLFLTSCILFREIFLRRLRDRFIQIQKQLDGNLIAISDEKQFTNKKLTIERNSFLIKEIERKSEAAKVLDRIPEAHFKVFQACNDYLKLTEKELERISANSPRLAPILRGRKYIMRLHKHHLLTWAELEAKALLQLSKTEQETREKLRKAQEAIERLDFALSFYPQEKSLIESMQVIRDIIFSINAAENIKLAEDAVSSNQIQEAIEYYQRALENLAISDGIEKEMMIEKINNELERLAFMKSNSANDDK